MTPEQFRTTLARLGWTQVRAGRALGVNARQARRWASGATPIPRSIEIALALIERHGLTADQVEAL